MIPGRLATETSAQHLSKCRKSCTKEKVLKAFLLEIDFQCKEVNFTHIKPVVARPCLLFYFEKAANVFFFQAADDGASHVDEISFYSDI